MRSWLARFGLPVLLVGLALVLYRDAGQHTRLDEEEALIWGNPAVTGHAISQILAGHWEAGEYRPQVRPVPTLVRVAEHALWDFDRTMYQRDQVILHGIAGFLLYFVFWSFTGSWLAAFLCGLLFVVHPGASESVLYLGGLAEILCTVFSLACLLALRPRAPAGWGGPLAVGAFALLAMLSKEAGFVLPLVAGAVIFASRLEHAQAKRQYIAVGSATALALAYRFVTLATLPELAKRIPAIDPASALPIMPLAFRAIAGIVVEASVIVLPLRLSSDYSWLLVLGRGALVTLGILSVALLVGAIWLATRFRRDPGRTGAVLVAVLPLLAPALLPSVCGSVATERNIYLALPGWCGLALLLGLAVTSRRRDLKPILLGAGFGVAVLFGVRTWARIPDFADQDRLLEAARRSYPRSPQVLFELGNGKLVAGDFAGAVDLYKQAMAIRPDFPMAAVNLGAAYFQQQNLGLALRTLDEVAVRSKHVHALRMVDAKAHYHAGLVLMKQERFKEAAEAFERTLLFYPDHLGARGNLGLIYVKSPHYAERGIALLKGAIAEETDPARRTTLQKALTRCESLLKEYVDTKGDLPSKLEKPEHYPIGRPWLVAAAEGM